MIDLYSSATPNGRKVTIMLEELGVKYNTIAINLDKKEQFSEQFSRISPSNKIPVIIDKENKQTIFESGAILLYLAKKYNKFLTNENYWDVVQWLFFQMGGVGPMMGQANVFYRYFPEKIPAAIERYQNESRRLLEVLDKRLQKVEWLAETYSIADIANWAWVRTYEWSGLTLDGLNNLKRWHEEMSARPACKKGIEIPELIEKIDDKERVKRARKWVTR